MFKEHIPTNDITFI